MSSEQPSASSRPGFSSWEAAGATRESAPRKALRFLLILAAHGAVLTAAALLVVRPDLIAEGQRIYIRMIEEQPRIAPRPAVTQEARPLPMVKQQTVRRPDPPPPILTAATDEAAPASFTVAPPPPAPPAPPVAAAPPAPPAVTEASFDADYLHNPKPVYPMAARRRGDEGSVLLRVRVGVDGNPLSVEIGQSSGSRLLDEAARDAVLRWRFVPARRGSETIESWVGVPITFRLDR
jgi:protein TonB